MKNIVIQSILILGFNSILNAQEIPEEFIENEIYNLSVDIGENWESYTTLGSPRFQLSQNELNQLNIHSRFGFQSINNSIALYGFGHFTFNNNFYGYLYPRIVNDIDAFPRYSGIPRDITRGGFNSGETDLSGIGYQSDWLTIQLGRGRENWGAGTNLQLALSKNSPPYDYGMIGLDMKNIRVKYIHGFLESTESIVNRYITARGVEWTNKKTLIFGLTETVIYSGENRPIDLGYMNPISTHLEIELNERLNSLGTGSANAVWQASLDWMVSPKIRLSGNFLFDEFVIDGIEKDAGKEHGLAYSGRISFTPVKNKSSLLTAYISLLKVGTPTFRHGSGTNNFVIRNKPLGWYYGSDGRELKIGMNYSNRNKLFLYMSTGKRERGEESITSRPYEPYKDYLAGPFPSGGVEIHEFISMDFKWVWKPSIQLEGKAEWGKNSEPNWIFGMNIYFPKNFKL